jgi:hypothetical protein
MGRVSDPESGIWGQWDMGENLPSNLGLLPSTSNPLNPLNSVHCALPNFILPYIKV